jgi:hypothetical protein
VVIYIPHYSFWVSYNSCNSQGNPVFITTPTGNQIFPTAPIGNPIIPVNPIGTQVVLTAPIGNPEYYS